MKVVITLDAAYMIKKDQGMATKVYFSRGVIAKGKNYYSMWCKMFEIDTRYIPIKPIGKDDYGIVCLDKNIETNDKVAIKNISNVFNN